MEKGPFAMNITALLAFASTLGPDTVPISIKPVGQTASVGTDADDPAIWVHPTQPSRSLILGTDKTELPGGGLYVFDLSGKVVRRIGALDRPNNVDVEYQFRLNGKTVDLAVVTERKKHRLRIFAIDRRSGNLTDVTGKTGVLTNETGANSEPMGIGLYRNPAGQIHAFVSPKNGPKEGYMAQYQLVANGGKIDVKPVRRFGAFSGEGEIESVLVDDELGFVYCSDEGAGIRKYSVNPKRPQQIALLGTDGYNGDREGLAIYATGKGKGFLFSSDQLDKGSITHVFRREGDNRLVAKLAGGADETDGIDVISAPLGPKYRFGIWVAMNSDQKNFLIYSGESIRRALGLK